MHPLAAVSSSGSSPASAGQGLDTDVWSARLETAQSAEQEQRISQDADVARSVKPQTGPVVDPKEIERLKKVSQDFESVFLSYLLKVGRETGMKGGFMGNSQGEQIFTEMRDDELAKHMAKAGGIGLSKLLVEQMTRVLQEQAAKRSAEQVQG